MMIDILLVEDNPSDLDLTLHALRKHGITDRIQTARDGAEALEILFGESVDAPADMPRLILLDLKLPKVDGLEVLKIIKSSPETRTIPVVVLTSSRETRDLTASYQHGVNSYIVKPVEYSRFLEVVQQLGFYWLLLNESHTT